MVNLRGIDLNLMTVFEAVYEEGSQVQAGQRLGMTQPAISNALNRLRHLVGDRLFQGRSKGLVATSRADDLYVSIHAALELIRREMSTRDSFNPASSRHTFVITISFGGGAIIGLPLFQRIREQAPDIRCIIRTIDPEEEIASLLREHRLDAAIHHARLDDRLLIHDPYMNYRAVVVARRGHPRAGDAVKSRESLLLEEFVGIHDPGNGLAQNPGLREIIEILRDRTVFEVPSTSLLPLVVSRTDLLTIMSSHMAELIAENYELDIYPTPAPLPEAQTFLIWHPSRRDDPAHGWLREQLGAVLAELEKTSPMVGGGASTGES